MLSFQKKDNIDGIFEALGFHILPEPFLFILRCGVNLVEHPAIHTLRHSEGLEEVFNMVTLIL